MLEVVDRLSGTHMHEGDKTGQVGQAHRLLPVFGQVGREGFDLLDERERDPDSLERVVVHQGLPLVEIEPLVLS